MSRRGFKTLLLLYPIPSTHSLRSNPLTTLPYTALKLSHQNFFCFVARYTAPPSSSDDDLEGLIDPDDSFSAESSLSKPVSPQEFSFLRDSLLASDSYSGSSVQSLNSGKSSNEAILISDAIHLNNDEFGEKTQKYLGQFREKLNPDLVVDVLNIMKNPELGVKFFIWAGRQIGYSHTRRVYTALLEILERGNNNRLPDHYLIEIKGDDNEVLGNLLNVLIRKCCRNGLWNLALEELGRLKDFGYKPSRLTYNALIQVFLRADQLETAHLVHREMSDSGFRMDELTLGIFVHSLCRTGKWREAFTLLEKEEFIPSTVLYTQMISGLCEASLFEEAMDVLNRMRSSFCIPNVVTYRTLLCGCLRKKQLGRCKRILSMMISEGCYPSPRIFNSLVHAYCRTGDYSYAYKLLKKMVNCGCKPGYVVYNILIGGICGNSESPSPSVLELAEKAYSEMLDEGVVLNKINVVNFASCLCGAGKYEKAHDIVREMMDKGFIPDTSTYSKVIGFCAMPRG